MFCVRKKRLKETFLLSSKNICFIECYLVIHKKTLFSESIVAEICFELASISKNRSSNFRGFTVSLLITGLSHNNMCYNVSGMR